MDAPPWPCPVCGAEVDVPPGTIEREATVTCPGCGEDLRTIYDGHWRLVRQDETEDEE